MTVRGTDKAHVTAAIDAFFADETKLNRKFTPESGEYRHDGVTLIVVQKRVGRAEMPITSFRCLCWEARC